MTYFLTLIKNISINTRVLALCFVCLFSINLDAQTWERFYDFSENDFLKSALVTEDGGVIFFGHYVYTLPSGFSESDVAMMKTDRDGQLVWEKTYTLGSYEEIFRAIPTSDGNFIAVGQTFHEGNGGGDGWILKIDQEGEILWEEKYGGSGYDRLTGIIETSDGGFAFCGSTESPASGDILEDSLGMRDSWIGKIDATGTLLWNHRFGSTEEDVLIDVIEAPNGDILSTGNYLLPISLGGHWQISLYRHDNISGDLIDNLLYGGAEFENVFSLINTADGGFAIGGITTSQGSGNADTYLLKIDVNMVQEWDQTYGGGAGEFAAYIRQMEDGGYTVLTSTRSQGSAELDVLMIRTDMSGESQWERLFEGGENTFDVPYPFSVDSDGNYLIIAQSQLKDALEEDILSCKSFIIKADALGNSTSNAITGKLSIDQGNNCIPESGESGLEDWLVIADGTAESYYATSNADGNYFVEVPPGDYSVRVIPSGTYWEACDGPAFISIDNPYDTTTYNFNFNDQSIVCADMEIDLSTPFLGYCEENIYNVKYRNNGTVASAGAMVDIILPTSFSLINSNATLIEQDDTLYVFSIEDVPVNEAGSFQFTVAHDCTNQVEGLTHELQARIRPDDICLPQAPVWDEASIELRANVIGDNVQFIIKNVGTGNMGQALTGVIIEDWFIPRTEPIQLNSFESDTITVTPEGKTVRLEIPQTAGHPGRSNPSITVEGVGTNMGGGITMGYVNHYPEDDANIFKSIDAQVSYDNFLPNVLRAYPRGYGIDRAIAPNDDIEYHLRFQHTGNDTLPWLYIENELPDELNVETLRPGASSHPYDYEIVGDGVVRFNFTNINLVGDEIDEAASYGFIKFKVSQQPGLANGTGFFNEVTVQTPNSRKKTNGVWHTIEYGNLYGAYIATHCTGDTLFGHVLTEDIVLRDTVSRVVQDSITTAKVYVLKNTINEVTVVLNPGELYNEVLYLEDTTLVKFYVADNGCDSIVNTQLDILTSTTSLEHSFQFSLYPNPGYEQVTLSYRLPVSSEISVKIYQPTGAVYQTINKGNQSAGLHRLKLPKGLPAGIYWVALRSSQGTAVRKLVIKSSD